MTTLTTTEATQQNTSSTTSFHLYSSPESILANQRHSELTNQTHSETENTLPPLGRPFTLKQASLGGRPVSFERISFVPRADSRTFDDRLKDYIKTPNPKPHLLIDAIIQRIGLRIIYTPSIFNAFLSTEFNLDTIIDCLECPITHTKLENPILLTSGHTVSKHSIENWRLQNSNINPFTNEPLEERLIPDFFAKSLIDLIKEKFEEIVSKSPMTPPPSTTPDPDYIIQEPVRWCRLLSVIMPENHYFVRKKFTNHYVLEARLPMDYQSTDYSVLRYSFKLNSQLKLVPINQRSERFEGYETPEDILRSLGRSNFVRLTSESINHYAKTLGKEKFLKNTNCQTKKTNTPLIDVINLLEMRLNPEKANKILEKNIQTIVARAGISPCSLPCFTLTSTNPTDPSKKLLWKATILNGEIKFLKSTHFIKDAKGNVCFQSDMNQPSRTRKKVLLIPLSEVKKEVADEWHKQKEHYQNSTNGTLFFLNENDCSLPLELIGRNFYKIPNMESGSHIGGYITLGDA